ncbi:hypothetical protein SALBM311S_11253 [Streptomyces alboniger]
MGNLVLARGAGTDAFPSWLVIVIIAVLIGVVLLVRRRG